MALSTADDAGDVAGDSDKEANTFDATDANANGRRRPSLTSRKSSFGETLEKFSTSFGHRRRLTTNLPHSSSVATVSFSHTQRFPPSGIPRSTSFFSNLNPFISQVNNSSNENGDRNQLPTPAIVKRTRKISDKIARTPFLSRQNSQQQEELTPLTPRSNRESIVNIETRGLMAPIQPTTPRSRTIGNLSLLGPQQTPSFMRPTSSSTNRQQSITITQQTKPTMPRLPSRGTLVRSPAPPSMCQPKQTWKSPAQPSLFPIRKENQPTRFPVRNPSLPFHPSPSAGTRRVTLNKGKGKEVATRPPSPNISNQDDQLPTSAYDISVEEKRHQQAEYMKTEFGGESEEDEDELTVTEDTEGDSRQLHRVERSHPNTILAEGRQSPRASGQQSDETLLKHADEAANEPEISYRAHEDEDPRLIHTALHQATWLGRFTSLSDHYRSTALPSPPSSPTTTNLSHPLAQSTTSFHTAHQMLDPARRNRRIFHHLHNLCTTDEARESLLEFKARYEAKFGIDGEGTKAPGIVREGEGKGQKKGKGWFGGLGGKKRN